jgi:CO dehydrogenase/acetyl-CoA synthase epsilon subunit
MNALTVSELRDALNDLSPEYDNIPVLVTDTTGEYLSGVTIPAIHNLESLTRYFDSSDLEELADEYDSDLVLVI